MPRNTNLFTKGGSRLVPMMVATSLAACSPGHGHVPHVPGGDFERGRAALVRHECNVCHVIPGVGGPTASVGPALDEYARRPYVAGKFPNEPETLVRWILDPPSMAPQTAMPAIAMPEGDARDIAAYLYQAE